MNTTLEKIFRKQSDYKVCDICNAINWYENENCIDCSGEVFTQLNDELMRKEIAFWEEEVGDNWGNVELNI